VWMLKDGTSKNKDQDCSSGCIPEVVFDLYNVDDKWQ